MSSKNRKNRARNQRRNQDVNRPRSSHPGWPNPPRGTGDSGKRRSKTLLALAALLVIAGVVVYAFNATKPGRNDASSQGAAAAPMPAAVAQPIPPGPRIKFANPVYEFGKVNGDD